MSTITIRIEGTIVTLVVDGRESVKVCGSESEARAYSLGYVSGQYDAYAHRNREHPTSEHDEYAQGYHQGYAAGLEQWPIAVSPAYNP